MLFFFGLVRPGAGEGVDAADRNGVLSAPGSSAAAGAARLQKSVARAAHGARLPPGKPRLWEPLQRKRRENDN